MNVRRAALTVLALAALCVAGCGGGDSAPLAAETDEPLYQQGLQLKRAGRNQEAFVSFLKLIEKRGERASPESHFEVGYIYYANFKDYIEAIHHFQKYLELKPNSPQAQGVRDLINTAKRELFRAMPVRPAEDFSVRSQDTAEIAELRRQNDELRAELATLRGGAVTPVTRSSRGLLPVDLSRPAPSDGSPFTPAPTNRSTASVANNNQFLQPAPITPTAPARSVATAPPTRPTPTPAAPAGRRYKVGPKETLFAIAKKFDPAAPMKKVREIADANPDVFPNGNINTPLKQGTELRIP